MLLKKENVLKEVSEPATVQDMQRKGWKEVKPKPPKNVESEQDAAIRNKAKDLGISSYHNMKIENLTAKIAEKEAEIQAAADEAAKKAAEQAGQ